MGMFFSLDMALRVYETGRRGKRKEAGQVARWNKVGE